MSESRADLLTLLEELVALGEREVEICKSARVLELIPLVRSRKILLERIASLAGGATLGELARDPGLAPSLERVRQLAETAMVHLAAHREDYSRSLADMQHQRQAVRSYSRSA